MLPSWGLSNAAATMVGQSLGAGEPKRAERAVWIAAGYNMAVLGAVGLIFIFFASPIVHVFTRDATAAAIGSSIKNAWRAPAFIVASSTARFST